jgi:hypothetical protein
MYTQITDELSLETVLLAALVPADIVTRLIRGEALIADSYKNATVTAPQILTRNGHG